MADLYCDYLNGNDGDNGLTPATPKQNLQAIVNIGSGGDTFNVANTSAQVLSANFSLASGFTADISKFTHIKSWDNGGAITIQRPDELTPRIGAIIDGADTYTFNSGNSRFVFENIHFTNFNSRVDFNQYQQIFGCEFSNISNTGDNGIQLYEGGTVTNSYFHDIDAISGLGGVFRVNISNNYFEDNIPAINYGDRANLTIATRCLVQNNIFKNNSYRNIRTSGGGEGNIIDGNSFESSGGANIIGIAEIAGDSEIINNVFYNFDGAGSKPIDATGGKLSRLGFNAFYDSNASTIPSDIGIDLTANDITGTGDPFVNSAGFDFTPTVASGLRGTGLGNPNSFIDIGAVQSESTVTPPLTDQNQYRANRSCD